MTTLAIPVVALCHALAPSDCVDHSPGVGAVPLPVCKQMVNDRKPSAQSYIIDQRGFGVFLMAKGRCNVIGGAPAIPDLWWIDPNGSLPVE